MKEYIINEMRLLSSHYKYIADCEELIRCKDCKYFNGDHKFCDYSIQVKSDDYCSYAEKKDC